MKLIIGGAWQGKTDAACAYFKVKKEDLLDGRICGMEQIYSAVGIHHFHEYVRRMLQDHIRTADFCERLYQQNPEIIVISDEIGYGLVPLEAFEREWRETTGRVCCELAVQSDQVLRVTAGIPCFIKG